MNKSITYQKYQARMRRVRAIRKRLSGTSEKPRLAVFRSLNHIYAQIIDDIKGHTLVSMSTKSKSEVFEGKTKTEKSREVGLKLAKKAIEAGISEICFDRAGFKYHGRIKALAEAAREGGLKF
ncbi:MAG: 50S ribosomal protein L18 [Candidatus Cloacimonetes bacterium]|nr:50S ribosomal protein L18 [Candidatus Cloacimonadota bacterium]